MVSGRRVGLSRNVNLGYSIHFPGIEGTSDARYQQPPSTKAIAASAHTKKKQPEPDIRDPARPPDDFDSESDELGGPQKRQGDTLDNASPTKRSKTSHTELGSSQGKKELKDESDSGSEELSKARSSQDSRRKVRNTFSKKPGKALKPRSISTKHDGQYEGPRRDAFKHPAQAPEQLPKTDAASGFKMPGLLSSSTVKDFNQPPRLVDTFKVPAKAQNKLNEPASIVDESAGSAPVPDTFKAPPSLPGSPGDYTGQRKRGNKSRRNIGRGAKAGVNLASLPETGLVMKQLGMTNSGKPDADENISESIDLSALSDTGFESASESSLSDVPDDFDDADVSTSLDICAEPSGKEMSGTRRCQTCQSMVLSTTFQAFLQTIPEHYRDKHLNTRHQLRFCRFHKDKTAKLEWQQRGYPSIDWVKMRTRVRDLQNDIESIIDGTAESHYSQEVLGDRKDEGGRRKKARSEFDGNFGSDRVGYYGGQGAKVIGEVMTPLCNSKLRANKDNEVMAAAGGLGSYIQKVIVPEVTSRLVAEDMKCGLSKARKILMDSADLGTQLNEELNDEVYEDEEDDGF